MPITDPIPDQDIHDALLSLQQRRHQHVQVITQNPIASITVLPTTDADQPVGPRDLENNHDLPPPPPPSPPPKIISVYPPFLDLPPPPAVKPVPLQSQGSRSIGEVFDPGEIELSSLPPIETSHHLHHHVHKNASLTTKALRGSHFRGFEDDDSISDEGKKKLANVSEEVILEKAIIAQWPPADQGNREKHIAPYEQNIAREIRHGSGGDWTGHMGRSGTGPGCDNSDRSDSRRAGKKPIFSCCHPKKWMQRRRYKVSSKLEEEWRPQAHFFTKVILIKAAQLLVINLWLLIVYLRGEVRNFLIDTHTWMYLSLGIFLILLVAIRIISKSKAGWWPLITLGCLVLLTCLLAHALSCVTFAYDAYCIPMVTVCLLVTCVTLPFVPFMTQSYVTKPMVIRVGAVLILIYSVVILVIVEFAKLAPMTSFATFTWFPGLIMAEIVLWVTIYEIQRVIRGYCFNVSEKRWAFTALYV